MSDDNSTGNRRAFKGREETHSAGFHICVSLWQMFIDNKLTTKEVLFAISCNPFSLEKNEELIRRLGWRKRRARRAFKKFEVLGILTSLQTGVWRIQP